MHEDTYRKCQYGGNYKLCDRKSVELDLEKVRKRLVAHQTADNKHRQRECHITHHLEGVKKESRQCNPEKKQENTDSCAKYIYTFYIISYQIVFP